MSVEEGKKAPDFNAAIDGGKKLKLDAKGIVYAGDMITFDKTNIDKYDF